MRPRPALRVLAIEHGSPSGPKATPRQHACNTFPVHPKAWPPGKGEPRRHNSLAYVQLWRTETAYSSAFSPRLPVPFPFFPPPLVVGGIQNGQEEHGARPRRRVLRCVTMTAVPSLAN